MRVQLPSFHSPTVFRQGIPGLPAMGLAAGLALVAIGSLQAAPATLQEGVPTEAPAQTAENDAHGGREVLRFAMVRSEGARMLNLPDVQGVGITEIPAGTIVAVHREVDGGWLEVDVPGGFPVWVYGRFLRETDREGVLEVTRNRINMRPAPTTDENSVNNYNIPERLMAGDRVALIELSEPGKALDEEVWARIWSPPGAGAYIQAERTRALNREENGQLLWARAERAVAEGTRAPRVGDSAQVQEASAGLEAGGASSGRPLPAALAALKTVREEIALEVQKDLPDFDQLQTRLDMILELDPDPLTRQEVAREKEYVSGHAVLFETKKRLEEEKQLRWQELVRRQQDQWERVREKDPQFGRFDLRGRLERIQEASGARVFRLWRGNEPVAELICESGRYDLEMFVGCELGIAAEPAESEEALESPLIRAEVARIEVLAVSRVK